MFAQKKGLVFYRESALYRTTHPELRCRDVELKASVFVSGSDHGVKDLVWFQTQTQLVFNQDQVGPTDHVTVV